MTLMAIDGLGGNEADLERMFAKDSKQLEPYLASDATIDRGTWRATLGDASLEASYMRFFEAELSEHGVDSTLQTFLPTLMEGVNGGAFHPMIQTWYAREHGELEDVAAALANWACFHSTLPTPERAEEPRPDGEESTLMHIITRLRADRELQGLRAKGAYIADRAAVVASHASFLAITRDLVLTEAGLQALRSTLAQTYVGFQNFSLLHGITSAQAMSGLLDVIPDKRAALSHYARSLLAVYVTIGMPPSDARPAAVPALPWPEIGRAAIDTLDSHIIKLVFSCRQEHKRTGDDLYLHIARLTATRTFRFQVRYSAEAA